MYVASRQILKRDASLFSSSARSESPLPHFFYRNSDLVERNLRIEIASYGATVCGERTAVFKAVSEGERDFQAIAVVTSNGASPCGICRQVLYEFGPQMIVIMADKDGQVTWEGPLTDLLPFGFGPKKLAEGQEAVES